MPPRRSSGSNLHIVPPSSTGVHLPLAPATANVLPTSSLPPRPSYGAVAASSMTRSSSEVNASQPASSSSSSEQQQHTPTKVQRPSNLRSMTMVANNSDGATSQQQQASSNGPAPSSARSTGAGQPQRRSVTTGPGLFDDASSLATPTSASAAAAASSLAGWESPVQLSQQLWLDGEQTPASVSSPTAQQASAAAAAATPAWVKPAVTRTSSSGPGSVWGLPAKVAALELDDTASGAAEARSRAAAAAARGLLAPEESAVPDAEISADVVLPSAVTASLEAEAASPTNASGAAAKLRGLKKPLRAATLDPKHLLSQRSNSNEGPASPVSPQDQQQQHHQYQQQQPQAPHPQRPVYYDGYNPAFMQQSQSMSPEMYAVYQHAPMHMDVAAFESYRTTPDPYAPIPPTPQAQHAQPLHPSSGSSGPSSVEQSPQFAPIMYGQPNAYAQNAPQQHTQQQQQYGYGPPPMIMQSPHMGAAMPMGVPWYPPPSPMLAHMGQAEVGSDKKHRSGHHQAQQQQQHHQMPYQPQPHMYGASSRSGGPSPVSFSPSHSHSSSYSSTYGPPQRHGGHRRIPTGPGGMMMPTGPPHPGYANAPPQHMPYGQLPDESYYQQPHMSRQHAGGMHSRNGSHASASHHYGGAAQARSAGAAGVGNGLHFTTNGSTQAHAAPGNAVRQNSVHSLTGSATGSLTTRSPLLDEFRSRVHKGRRFELADILGNVVEFSGDQHGSRFTQERLDVASPDERQAVFEEILPSARVLMEDVFGNYVIQKLFEHGTQEQRTRLLGEMKGHILSLSLGTYGCRVVQKAIDHVQPDEQLALTQELRGNVLMCVKDQNANHVIQKIIERVRPSAKIDFIAAAFKDQVPVLASHCYSCRVLQRIFEYCDEAQARPLLDELHRHTATLVQDQFGNYVTQFVLQKGQARDRQAVIECARGKVLVLSKHKFASNVVEEIFRVASPEDRFDLIEEILAPRPAQPANVDASLPLQQQLGQGDAIALMMRDQYANYVVQRSLEVAEGEQRTRLIAAIRPHLANMRTRYSKHLLAIEKLIGAGTSEGSTSTNINDESNNNSTTTNANATTINKSTPTKQVTPLSSV